jgi:predicted Zn-ribbon and HTH transcriptional regulator
MCDSDIELTEVGIKEEQERAERKARWAQEAAEEEPVDKAELEAALEELKREFEELMTQTIKCTECEWSGTEEDCEKEGICPNCCAYTEEIVRDDE